MRLSTVVFSRTDGPIKARNSPERTEIEMMKDLIFSCRGDTSHDVTEQNGIFDVGHRGKPLCLVTTRYVTN